MKVPEVDSDMADYTICGLGCGKRTKSGKACRRYITGVFFNPYFTASNPAVMPGKSCDLRNQEWRCWQHLDVINNGVFDTENAI
ncbi:MAG: hypothetical protein Q8R28_15270 [Dehalococcoidia bacterium]|nr:hypothetical protein [Dehalococcoidia bacterium]